MNTRSLILLSVILTPTLAHAHDFWFERHDDGFVLQYGHHGGKVLPIQAGKVKSIRCLQRGAGPKDVLKVANFSPSDVRVPSSCDAISAFHYGGFWSQTPDGDKNLGKSHVPDAVKSWESKQFAKWVNTHSPLASTPIGDEFEIIPVTDLSHVKQGDKASVRVLFRGKPVSGAIAAIDHKPLGETDSAGEVRLRVRSSSVETISATLRNTVSTPEADSQVFEASLSFDVAK